MIENIKIKDLAKKYGIFAKKSLGQNFIFDLNLTGKIVSNAKITKDDHIIEIGSGAGSLTFSILKQNPKSLTIIEKDNRCIALLQELKEYFSDKIDTKITIIEGDFLTINLTEIFDKNYKIISNLPYNIATKILFLLLDHYQKIDLMILMFQKEVCHRIVAQNNSKKYGRMAVMVNFLCQSSYLFDIGAKNFTPAPKVESGLVAIKPRSKPIFDIDLKLLEKITETAFNQRRKMLRSSLNPLSNNVLLWLEKAGIKNDLRAENLRLEDFAKLVKNY
ncbi:16S rRNA (adenine(1518)-N(6)/adenine(1519)-N(6))-dimethyltransferase RsmA [Rickettsiales bacterium]|nr:16S rRNA (adenine(1518)-N(6)/adenine(1519)-N(6))-dimethyltransferase RsmA [Rickettsiales bacterium]